MAAQKLQSARQIATTALNRFFSAAGRKHIDETLNPLLKQTDEKQKATDIVFGSIRNCRAIDTVIATLADCPIERIPAKPLSTIRAAAYELIYCPATAEYAIVNEAVENTKAMRGKKPAGFVNAVLRQITRHIKNRQVLLSDADVRKTLPQSPTTGCEFDTDLMPEPLTSQPEYLSCAFSLPKWLIQSWLEQFGPEQTEQICFGSNRRPSVYLRPNTLKTKPQQLAQQLRDANVAVQTSPDKTMIKLTSPSTISQLPGFAEGLFTVQDISAALPVRMLGPGSGWKILDLCAAPGTKTTQLAELANDKATIYATDIDSTRLEKVQENIERLGIKSVKIVKYEKIRQTPEEFGPFDCILLDVPCSNTGVLARRSDLRLRIKPAAIEKLTRIQAELLDFAAAQIKPGGKICYSTCSIQKEENDGLMKNFLQRNPDFELELERLTLPSAREFDHDGGYAAITKAK